MVILSFKPDGADVHHGVYLHADTGKLSRGAGAGGFPPVRPWNNLVVSGLAVALSLVVGVPAAYALGRYQFKGPGRHRLHLSLFPLRP